MVVKNMSLDNLESVDAVGTEKHSGTVALSILDAWDWNDQNRHLTTLQAKLDAYFGFVESGKSMRLTRLRPERRCGSIS